MQLTLCVCVCGFHNNNNNTKNNKLWQTFCKCRTSLKILISNQRANILLEKQLILIKLTKLLFVLLLLLLL